MGGNFKIRALRDEHDVIKFYRGDVFIFTNGRTKFYLTNGRFVDSSEYDSFEDFLKRNVDWKDYFELIEEEGENKMELSKVNFKVKCLDVRGCNKSYTNGKIYEVVDGVFTCDDGYNIIGIDSFDELNNMTSAMWELVEDSSDLRELIKPCCAVRIRDGRWLIAFMRKDGDIAMQEIKDISWGVTLVSSFTKDLCNSNSSQYDIMEIRGYIDGDQTNIENRDIIWKRTELSPTQLKLEELEKKQREIADEMEKLRKEL